MPPRKRTCTGPDCTERIKGRHYFCMECLRKLSSNTRGRLFDAYRKGAGLALIEIVEECRAYIGASKEKDRKMVSGKSDLVEVALEKRMDTPAKAAIAFWQGDYDANDKEEWIWLPRSQIEVEDGEGKACTVTMPEWLAKDKGLI